MTASVFTGSFVGDGSGLYGISASGVTGLNLSQISTGSVTASVSPNGFNVNSNTSITGTLKVTGTIVAEQIDVTIYSSSVLYQSGSTRFGDSLDDSHNITGSVNISGSISLNGQAIGTGKLDETVFNSYTASNNPRVSALEASTSSLNSFSNSVNSYTTSLNSYTTSLNSYTTSLNSYTTSLNSYTSSNNSRLSALEVSSGSLNSFTSSIDTTIKNKLNNDGVISGSIQVEITGTTGYSTLSSSLASTNLNQEMRIGSLETSTSSLNSFSSSATSRLNSIEISTSSLGSYTSSTNERLTIIESTTGSLNNYTSSNNTRLSTIETATSSLNSFTSSIDTTIKNKLNTDNVISGSIQVDITQTTNYTSFSSSLATTDLNQTNKISAIESTTSSLNTFTSSTNTRLNGIESTSASLNTYTSSNTTNINAIHTATSSLNTYTSSNNTRLGVIESTTSSLNTHTSSTDNRLSSIETSTGSLNSYTSSNNTRLSVIETATSSLNSYTSSTNTRLGLIETSTSSLNSFTSSINTTIKNKLNTDGVISGSAQINLTSTTGYSTFSSSIAAIDAAQDVRLNSIEGKTGSYATTGSNIFIGNQTITGSLFVSQDLIIAGSSSIQHISSSVVNIADNIITVNAQNPSIRFGGLAVIDSGSSPQVSGSMLFDSVNDQWIFVHQNQGTITSSVLLMGPETFNNLGGETYLTQNRIPKGSGIEHLRDSNITDIGTKVSINSNTEVTGTFIATGTVYGTNITAIESTTSSLNSYTSSTNTRLGLIETSTGSLNTFTSSTNTRLGAIETTTSSLNSYTSSNTTNINAIHTATSSLNSYTSSTNTRLGIIESTTSSLNSYTSSNNTTVSTQNSRLTALETTTSSLNSYTSSNTTNINAIHTATSSLNSFTSSAGGRLTSIETATSSLNSYTSSTNTRLSGIETSTGSLNSFTSSINTTIKNKLNTETVISGSAQVVSALPAGTVSGSIQVSIASTTGFGTYLDQAVKTGSTVTFNYVNSNRLIQTAHSTTLSNSSYNTEAIVYANAGAGANIYPGYGFHKSGELGVFLYATNRTTLRMRGDDGSDNLIYNSANLTNLNQLSNGPGYITSAANWFGAETTSGTLDWNHVTNTRPGSGYTLLLGSATNGFSVSDYYHAFNLEYATKNGTGQVTQLAIAYGTPGNDIRMRGRYDGTWSSWVRILNSSNFSSFAMSGAGYSANQNLNTTSSPTFSTVSATTFTGALSGNSTTASSTSTLTSSGSLTTQAGSGTLILTSPIVSSEAGLFSTGDNSNAIITLNRHPGAYYSQLGFNSSGGLYYRSFNNTSINTSQGWQTIWTSSSLTNLNQLTNGPGYITGISFANVSSKPTTLSGYGITDALSNNNDSEQVVGCHDIFWNYGVGVIKSDARWNESGYDADLGTLHIYSTTAAGANYGRTGIALYNGSAYQYLTTKASTTGLFANNSLILTAGNYTSYAMQGAGYSANQNLNTNSTVQFGSLGVGVSPALTVHFRGSNEMVRFENTSTSSNQYCQLNMRAGNRNGYIWIGNENTSSWAGAGGLNIYTDNGNVDLWTNAVQRVRIQTDGHMVPFANNTYDLGSASLGWRNVYTNDLHLSNMNKSDGNDVDGTKGNWTIQEGAENLYINNNNGKKFKISLEEII
jgi:ABC-type transporter Mla subunit MlaD